MKRWHGGDQREGWVGYGLLVAEKQFRRVHHFHDAQQLCTAARRQGGVGEGAAYEKTRSPPVSAASISYGSGWRPAVGLPGSSIKETQTFLASRPNRFQYVLTPKHGSWLNIVETLFGKMARTFLRHIRVQSWKELRDRILRGIAEINAAPVVHRWKKFDTLTPASQDTIL